jgi:drug/metabolite transporter (DMT)-like permease
MLTAGAIAVIAFAIALLLKSAKKAPKTRVVLMLLAGFGIGGILGSFLARFGRFLAHATEVGTSRLFGVGVPVLLVIVMVVWLVLQMEPKNSTPHDRAMWVALLLPAVLAISGGVWWQIGQHTSVVLTSLGQQTTDLVTSLAQSW